jgi:hypothetical protein
MVEEIFDDGKEPTPQQKAMMQALMGGGMLKFSYKEDGTVDINVIPISDIYLDPPKDPQ